MFFPRTTLTIASRQSLENLEAIRQRRQQATEEISTGLRVRRPSDGPAEAGGVVRTRSDISLLDQFKSNLQTVKEQLGAADSVLNQALDVLTRANTLASQAANFNQTVATRSSIAVDVEGLITSLLSVANTSFGGKFLFAGLEEETQPFLVDDSSPDGVIYRGDQGRRSVAFPGGTESPVTLDGQTIFLNPDNFLGSGRTAGTVGATTPNPPLGVGIAFTNGLTGTLVADLPSFFVASTSTTAPGAGDQATVNFTSADGSINTSITTAPFAGGETTAQIAAALNAEVALNPALAGKVTFSDEGGNLKLVESDTAGVGLNFTASSTGSFVTGLESGGAVGGLSAQEIAAALNAQVALNPSLSSAKVRFSAVNGQVEVDGDVGFTFTAVDFPRGTGFVSGLAGQHSVGGLESANVFRVLNDLHKALLANDVNGITAALDGLNRGVQHLSNVQGFYGAAQRQTLTAFDSLSQFNLVDQEKLSTLQDADLVEAAGDLSLAQTNEEAALRVAARLTGRSLFDFLA